MLVGAARTKAGNGALMMMFNGESSPKSCGLAAAGDETAHASATSQNQNQNPLNIRPPS